MNNRVLQKSNELLTQGVPFALATVVRRERPTSGEPGDKAIITPDGNFRTDRGHGGPPSTRF